MKFMLVALALSSPFFGSCSKFSYVGMELDVHYDGETDKLVMLEVEHGIHRYGSCSLSDAIDTLQRAASGGRVIPPEDGFSVDFDKMEQALSDGNAKDMKPRDRDAAEFARGVKVVKSGLFLDGEGRLSLFRMWTVSNFKRALAIVNEGINETVLDGGSPDENFKPSFGLYDVETRDLQRARATAHAAWLSADKSSLVLDVPMTPACAARTLAGLIEQKREPRAPLFVSLWSQMSSLEVRDNRAILRFAPTRGEWMHFAWDWPDDHYSDDMLNNLKENKGFLDESATLKQLREMMKTH
jgi:hypothetical protein